MSPKSAELFKLALELSVEERADLAVQILESLDASDDPSVQAAWQAEIERRMADLDTGRVMGVSLEQAKSKFVPFSNDFETIHRSSSSHSLKLTKL